MKIQLCNIEHNKQEIYNSLVYLLKNHSSDYISNIIFNVKSYHYIVIDDDKLYVSKNHLNIFEYLFIYSNDFIKIVELLKKCDDNTYIIDINDKLDYLKLKLNHFKYIYNETEIFQNVIWNLKFSCLLIINNEAHMINKKLSYELFNYKRIDSTLYIRNIKLKNIITS